MLVLGRAHWRPIRNVYGPTGSPTSSVHLHIYVPSHIWLKYRCMWLLTTNRSLLWHKIFWTETEKGYLRPDYWEMTEIAVFNECSRCKPVFHMFSNVTSFVTYIHHKVNIVAYNSKVLYWCNASIRWKLKLFAICFSTFSLLQCDYVIPT